MSKIALFPRPLVKLKISFYSCLRRFAFFFPWRIGNIRDFLFNRLTKRAISFRNFSATHCDFFPGNRFTELTIFGREINDSFVRHLWHNLPIFSHDQKTNSATFCVVFWRNLRWFFLEWIINIAICFHDLWYNSRHFSTVVWRNSQFFSRWIGNIRDFFLSQSFDENS